MRGIDALLEAKHALAAPVRIDVQLVDLRNDPSLRARFAARWDRIEGLSFMIKPLFSYPNVHVDESEGQRWSGPCAWPFLSMVVTADGRVAACCADFNVELLLGDVRIASLQEIWNGNRYRELRRRFVLERATADSLCGRCGFYGRKT